MNVHSDSYLGQRKYRINTLSLLRLYSQLRRTFWLHCSIEYYRLLLQRRAKQTQRWSRRKWEALEEQLFLLHTNDRAGDETVETEEEEEEEAEGRGGSRGEQV